MKKVSLEVVSLVFLLCFMNIPVGSDFTSEVYQTVGDIEMSGAYGEDPILTNHQQNPGFEELQSYDLPSGWDSWGYAYRSKNATYQDLVHNGSYAGQMLSLGDHQWASACSWGKVLQFLGDVLISGDLFFSFYYNLQSIPDPVTKDGRFYVKILTSSYYLLYYYLSYQNDFTPTNNSDHVHFMANSTIDTWHQLKRNVTADFVEAFGTPPPSEKIEVMDICLSNPRDSDIISEVVIDDVSLLDDTLTEWMTGGDFETGSDWESEVWSPSHITPSSDSTQGLLSVNLSAYAIGVDTKGEAHIQKYYDRPGFSVASHGTSILEFDWKYYDTWNGGNQWAYASIYVLNETYHHSIRFILGADYDTPVVSNSSYATHILDENLGSRGTWEHFYKDIYEVLQDLNITDVEIIDMGFHLYLGTRANSTCRLLVDDFKFLSYPAGNAGFEKDYQYPRYPITGWDTYGSGIPYLNQTIDSHSGRYATNITLYGTSTMTSGVQRSTLLDIEPSLFTDFWWRLDELSGTGSYVIATLELDYGTRYIHYVLAGPSTLTLSNSSSSGYFKVANYNLTGQWSNLVRNLNDDIEESFGVGDYTVTSIVLYGYLQANESLSVMFDDIHFIRDTHAPVIDSPDDIEFTFGESGFLIDWDPIDIQPASYEVFVDGVSTFMGLWNDSSEHIVVDLDGLAVGTYNYTCVVIDDLGNTAKDTVLVTVNETVTTPTTTTTTPPIDRTTMLIIIGAGVVIVIIIIMSRRR